MYQALYRKHRPKSFSDVAGQKHITETLRAQVQSDRMTHAYLFVGTRGTGKTTCAKILSRAVNCLSPIDGDPCNKCASCVGIENGTILDVLELDAASNNGVDDVRTLRDEAIYLPSSVKKRVYIVDEVHMLSMPAFNALLKTLEEPPEHIIFILATTELHKVPATIQSRCQRFSFKRLSVDEIAERLDEIATSESLPLTQEAAEKLAMLADGSMRDGISLLDQCVLGKDIDLKHVQDTLGLTSQSELLDLSRAIAGCDAYAALEIIDKLYAEGKDMAALLSELSGVLRDLLVVKLAPSSSLVSSGISRSDLSKLSEPLTTERLYDCLEIAKNALLSLSRIGIPKLVLEMCIIKMCGGNSQFTIHNSQLSGQTVGRDALGAPPSPPTPQDNGRQVATPTDAHEQTAHNGRQDAAPTIPTPHSEKEDLLTGIVKAIDDPALRALLDDAGKVQVSRDGDVLILKMADSFSADSIEHSYMDTLGDAVRETIGDKIRVRIETGQVKDTGEKQSKLEDLKAFGGIVNFEN